jgi:hypothetical protein
MRSSCRSLSPQYCTRQGSGAARHAVLKGGLGDQEPSCRHGGARRRRLPPPDAFCGTSGAMACSPAPCPLTEPVGSTPCSSQTTCRGLLTHQRVVRGSGQVPRQRPASPQLAVLGFQTRFKAAEGPGAGSGYAVRRQCDPRRSHSPPRTWRRSGCRTGRPAKEVGGRGGAIGSRGVGPGQFAEGPRRGPQAGQLSPGGPSIAHGWTAGQLHLNVNYLAHFGGPRFKLLIGRRGLSELSGCDAA